jgi:hypothetical protein
MLRWVLNEVEIILLEECSAAGRVLNYLTICITTLGFPPMKGVTKRRITG